MPVGLATSTWPNSFDFSRALNAPDEGDREVPVKHLHGYSVYRRRVALAFPRSPLSPAPGSATARLTASTPLPRGVGDHRWHGRLDKRLYDAVVAASVVLRGRHRGHPRRQGRLGLVVVRGSDDAPMSRMRLATASLTCGWNVASGSFSTSRRYSPSGFSKTPSTPAASP